jgi:hypothetical protein
MIATNVHISQKAQELLIKAAALKNLSVEDLASEILSEGIEEKLSGIVPEDETLKEYPPNPLAARQPYAYFADPGEPAIPPSEWEMNTVDGDLG